MKRLILSGVLFGVALIGAASAPPADAMKLRSVVGSGGSPAAGTRKMVGTIGQPAIGVSQNATMTVFHGFWMGGILTAGAVQDDPHGIPGIPLELAFGAPIPNPTQSRAQFELALPAAGSVRLSVVDVTGRLVSVAADGRLEAGHHLIRWDGRDARGNSLSAGIYFARLEVDGKVVGKRSVVLVR